MSVTDAAIEEACRQSFATAPGARGDSQRVRSVVAVLTASGWDATWPEGRPRRGLPAALRRRFAVGRSEIMATVDMDYLADHVRSFRRHQVCPTCGQLRP